MRSLFTRSDWLRRLLNAVLWPSNFCKKTFPSKWRLSTFVNFFCVTSKWHHTPPPPSWLFRIMDPNADFLNTFSMTFCKIVKLFFFLTSFTLFYYFKLFNEKRKYATYFSYKTNKYPHTHSHKHSPTHTHLHTVPPTHFQDHSHKMWMWVCHSVCVCVVVLVFACASLCVCSFPSKLMRVSLSMYVCVCACLHETCRHIT